MRYRYFKKIKDQIQNTQNRRSGEISNLVYEAYKNTVMPNGRHIYTKAYDMAKTAMCAYSQSYHALPHWKFELRCCSKCPCVNLPYQETYYQYSKTSTSILFHIYHLIWHCTTHGRLPLI